MIPSPGSCHSSHGCHCLVRCAPRQNVSRTQCVNLPEIGPEKRSRFRRPWETKSTTIFYSHHHLFFYDIQLVRITYRRAMLFTGCCTYPRGGYVFVSLFLSTAAALACTTYAVISCRFAVVQFTSINNGFEDAFSPRPVESSFLTQYRAAIGLFHWLRPISFDVAFTQGSCVGYQDSMLNAISEPFFDVARGSAVFGFLLNGLAFFWVWSTACIEYRNIPALLLFLVCLSGSIATGLTFLLPFRSELCQGGILDSAVCQIDQAGLVMSAASLFGMVSAVSIFTHLVNHEIFIPEALPRHPKGRRVWRIPVDFDDQDLEVSSVPKRILFPTVASLSSKSSGWSRRRLDQSLRTIDQSMCTIDHSEPAATEVYIKDRLDRIEKELASV